MMVTFEKMQRLASKHVHFTFLKKGSQILRPLKFHPTTFGRQKNGIPPQPESSWWLNQPI